MEMGDVVQGLGVRGESVSEEYFPDMQAQEVLHPLMEARDRPCELVAVVEVAQVQVTGQLQSQVSMAACKKAVETGTGIPDWMTGPWQELMQFDWRQMVQKDEFVQKLRQPTCLTMATQRQCLPT
jgi:hypothetical protein